MALKLGKHLQNKRSYATHRHKLKERRKITTQREDNSIDMARDPDPSVNVPESNEAVQFKSRRSLFTSLNTGSMQVIRKSIPEYAIFDVVRNIITFLMNCPLHLRFFDDRCSTTAWKSWASHNIFLINDSTI
jgi:hypothetical protein